MKTYIAPELIVHGKVEQMTQNINNCGKVDALGSALPPYGETSNPGSSQCNPPKN